MAHTAASLGWQSAYVTRHDVAKGELMTAEGQRAEALNVVAIGH
ncbi:MAG TPA: hypothetical protein VIO57_05640 [Chloroflexota bacterium]